MKSKTLVLPDGNEVTIADLELIKKDAILVWKKAEEQIRQAESKRRNAEDIILGCNQRIRILKLILEQ